MSKDVIPTRSELIKLKQKIKLAKGGYKLLKKKRDGLILDFFEILKKAKTIRSELVGAYVQAQKRVNVARVLEGDVKVKSLAFAVSNKPQISLSSKNIMGVVVPTIEQQDDSSPHRGWGTYNAASVDDAASAYQEVIKKIILLKLRTT